MLVVGWLGACRPKMQRGNVEFPFQMVKDIVADRPVVAKHDECPAPQSAPRGDSGENSAAT